MKETLIFVIFRERIEWFMEEGQMFLGLVWLVFGVLNIHRVL